MTTLTIPVPDAFRDLTAQLTTEENAAVKDMIDRAYTAGARHAEAEAKSRSQAAAEATRTKVAAFEDGFRQGAELNAKLAAEASVIGARTTQFVIAAIKAERARWQAAMTSEAAQGRETVVARLLANTDLPAEEITALAGDLPAAGQHDHGFSKLMSQNAQGAAPEMSDSPSLDDTAKAKRLEELREVGKTIGRAPIPAGL